MREATPSAGVLYAVVYWRKFAQHFLPLSFLPVFLDYASGVGSVKLVRLAIFSTARREVDAIVAAELRTNFARREAKQSGESLGVEVGRFTSLLYWLMIKL